MCSRLTIRAIQCNTDFLSRCKLRLPNKHDYAHLEANAQVHHHL